MIVRETGEQPETQRYYHNKSESSGVHEKGWYSSSNYKLDKYQGFFKKKIFRGDQTKLSRNEGVKLK